MAHATEAFERALVARVREGSSLAFQELFHQYRRLVHSLAYRLLNDAEDARDLCQDVFLTVHRRIGSLRDPGKLRAWICRITVTRAYNLERSMRRRGRFSTVSLDRPEHDARQELTSGDDPERALVSAEIRSRIDQALSALPFANRSVVVLRDVEGLSYEEIAVALDVNLGTVKSRLARGREALRAELHDLLASRRRAVKPPIQIDGPAKPSDRSAS